MDENTQLPETPVVTDQDRQKFMERLKAGLKEQGLSQRKLEVKAGWSTGTCSKIFKGTLSLQFKHLAEIAQVLKLEELLDLVEGTAYEHLLKEAPPSPTSQRIRDLEAERDAANAAAKAQREVAALAQKQTAELRTSLQKTERELDERELRISLIEGLQRQSEHKMEEMEGELKKRRQLLLKSRAHIQRLQNREQAQVMRIQELRTLYAEALDDLEDVRERAIERHQRVQHLELYAKQLGQQLAVVKGQADNVAPASFLSGLGGFVAGLGLAAAAASSGREADDDW